MYSEIEREAANWVLEQADDGILITNDDVKEKALEIAKRVNLPNLKASDGWIDRLKKRKGISLRMVTHIPAGLTGQHQPLDVGVNKPFKAQYRKEFHKWRKMQKKSDATKGKNMKNPTRQDVLNFTSAAWESITEECIKNAFLKSEITFVESIFEVEEEMADL